MSAPTDTMRCPASDWLDEVREASGGIERLVREVSALLDARDECVSWQPRGAGGGAANTHSDPTAAQAMARMAQLDELIEDRRAEYAQAQELVGTCLAMLAYMRGSLGERHADAIEIYYVDRAPTWSMVAEEMGCSRRWVQEIRKESYAWIEQHFAHLLT